MAHVISVLPAEGGWKVLAGTLAANEMMFLSGAKAETAARRLAEKFAQSGQASEIHIQLRDGSLAARLVCPALEGSAV